MISREESIRRQNIAIGRRVYKVRLDAPNDDGELFFTAESDYQARKKRDALGLKGGVRRATLQELIIIAADALDGGSQ